MFYARVDRDPILRPLFPGKSLHCAVEELAAFLAQFLGGPGEDSQRRWWLSLRESHQRSQIGPRERAAWIANMVEALDEARIAEPFRAALLAFFEQSSAHVVNQGTVAPPADSASATETSREFSRRWQAHRRLDDAVAAIRAGDTARAIEIAESPEVELCGRTIFCGLLALMLRRGPAGMLEYVARKLTADPSLLHERYAGFPLLHEAAAAGRLEIVRLLLHLGADPNLQDAGSHTPLYAVANGCPAHQGGAVARALIAAGADVNACDGVQRTTPLHMAARRGNLGVAEALLESGADPDVRDRRGDTPLRRAENCRKTALAALLRSRASQ
jgi:truncated hemoglobin YjbI